MTLLELVELTGCTQGTCSIDHPKDRCVTFARSEKYLNRFIENLRNSPGAHGIVVVVPEETTLVEVGKMGRIVAVYRTKYVDYEFTMYHNNWWMHKRIPDVQLNGCKIHPTAVIDEGIRVANGPDGAKVQLRHVGDVLFGTDVYVGPLTLIERGCIDCTTIGNNVKIDGRCCVGHNSVIGNNTVLATGATVGGSAKIGKDCWLGLDSTVLNGRSICDKVIIGAGCVVNKDITTSGVYVGVPAKYIKPYVEEYNF